MSTILELKNISFVVQKQPIVENINCAFEEGKSTALVGPSGCGKSTILKLAAGLLVPTCGTVEYRGKDIFKLTRQENLSFRRESDFIFQDSALWANQNLFQTLELPLIIHFPQWSGDKRRLRINQTVNMVGYKKSLDIRPSNLSPGEQKLIGCARALICNPSLLFLDEWTESLDETAAAHLNKLVQQSQKERNTLIFITHDIDIIKGLADQVIRIQNGKMSSELSSDQIQSATYEALANFVEKGKLS